LLAGGGIGQGRRILIRRPRSRASGGRRCKTGGERAAVAPGGDLACTMPNLARALGSPRRLRLQEAHEAVRHPRAAVSVETRRCGRASRRRNTGTPATAPRRLGARGRRRATRVHSSPPGAALGQLHGRDAAATAEIDGGGGGELELGFRRRSGLAAKARVEDPRGGGRLK
jgi:hypothetical protein